MVDSYDVREQDFTAWRRLLPCLVVIDDLADRFLDVDAVLNGSPHGARLAYRTAPGCALFLGPAYALLRPSFRNTAPREAPEVVSRVLITLGGAYPRCTDRRGGRGGRNEPCRVRSSTSSSDRCSDPHRDRTREPEPARSNSHSPGAGGSGAADAGGGSRSVGRRPDALRAGGDRCSDGRDPAWHRIRNGTSQRSTGSTRRGWYPAANACRQLVGPRTGVRRPGRRSPPARLAERARPRAVRRQWRAARS